MTPVPDDYLSLILHKEDVRTFADLLSICAQTFEQLALDAAKGNDEKSFSILQNRHRLSALFALKLGDACKMPEPVSREIH